MAPTPASAICMNQQLLNIGLTTQQQTERGPPLQVCQVVGKLATTAHHLLLALILSTIVSPAQPLQYIGLFIIR